MRRVRIRESAHRADRGGSLGERAVSGRLRSVSGSSRRAASGRAVRPLSVVMRDVDAEDVLELATAEDEQPVEAFSADGADPALHVGVRIRARTGADDPDTVALEESIKGA